MGEFARAVEHGIDSRFIDWADAYWKLDEDRRKAVTTSQLRNVFGAVKRMEMLGGLPLAELLLLRPRLRYTAGRENDKRKRRYYEELADEVEAAIEAVASGPSQPVQEERFRRFCQGFEAILAYHRAAGGK